MTKLSNGQTSMSLKGMSMRINRYCQVCGKWLGYCQANKKTCSDRCRKVLSRSTRQIVTVKAEDSLSQLAAPDRDK